MSATPVWYFLRKLLWLSYKILFWSIKLMSLLKTNLSTTLENVVGTEIGLWLDTAFIISLINWYDFSISHNTIFDRFVKYYTQWTVSGLDNVSLQSFNVLTDKLSRPLLLEDTEDFSECIICWISTSSVGFKNKESHVLVLKLQRISFLTKNWRND